MRHAHLPCGCRSQRNDEDWNRLCLRRFVLIHRSITRHHPSNRLQIVFLELRTRLKAMLAGNPTFSAPALTGVMPFLRLGCKFVAYGSVKALSTSFRVVPADIFFPVSPFLRFFSVSLSVRFSGPRWAPRGRTSRRRQRRPGRAAPRSRAADRPNPRRACARLMASLRPCFPRFLKPALGERTAT